MNRTHVSLITPAIFQEHVIRVFVKDASKYALVEQAFQKMCSERLGATPKKGKDSKKSRYNLTQDSQMI